MSDFIPPTYANFPAWQAIVSRAFNELSKRVKPRVIPMVDGSIPAVFIQEADGSLVLVEIE